MGLSSSFGWASDHGEPRSAWWSAGILCFVVSVCLAGVMVSACCWLALACPSRSLTVFVSVFWFCEADVVPCFSGSIPVGFSGSIPVVFSGSIPVGFFRLETCGFSG